MTEAPTAISLEMEGVNNMAAIKVQLPKELQSYVDECVADGDHPDASAFLVSLLREEQKRRAEKELLALVREAKASGPATPMTRKDWEGIRRRGLARIAAQKGAHAKRRQKVRSRR